MALLLHRRVFRWHPKGVPSHRMKNGMAFRPAITRYNIAHCIVAHMAHMDAARWIGKHLQHVIFRAWIIGLRLEDTILVPAFLPAGFGFAEIITG